MLKIKIDGLELCHTILIFSPTNSFSSFFLTINFSVYSYFFRSLNTLRDVLHSVSTGENFIPFRGSVLTTEIQELFHDNNKIIVIANINSVLQDNNEDLNTLTYAMRIRG